MLHDRGNKKWSAMMLSEHVEMLRDLEKEEVQPITRAEWELEDLQQIVHYALHTKAIIRLILWEENEIVGVIISYNQVKCELLMATATTTKRVAISSISTVQLMEEYHDSL
ncbi:YolD-like family protein [Metasolibacillus meyeri]|uniref:YolD-like family protein n=1 Tax=Metasolibacillus meyeri TaxID=1071052 RepID=UPI000D307511|nr:YolD-like family protein [Metasolibacillus meyeri]